jgi:hypothetical protein
LPADFNAYFRRPCGHVKDPTAGLHSERACQDLSPLYVPSQREKTGLEIIGEGDVFKHPFNLKIS